MAVNTRLNALVRCGLLTDANFAKTLDKCLQPATASKMEQLNMTA